MNVRALLCLTALFADLLLGAQVALGDITLRLTSWDGDGKFIKPVLRQFELSHPGIHVRYEGYGDYGQYHSKLLVQYAANTAPDVALMDPGNFQALAKRKAILPLNDFFERTPGFRIQDYYKPIIDVHTYQGKLYVLPRDISPSGLIYYNKKAFDEAHIPYPDGTWTWDYQERPWLKEKDFLWVLHHLTKTQDGKITQYGLVPAWPQKMYDDLSTGNGSRVADNYQNPTRVTYNDPRMAKAYQLAWDLWYKYKWVPSGTDMSTSLMSTADQLFEKGSAAMYVSGAWDIDKIRQAVVPGTPGDFDWDIALFPAHAGERLKMTTGGSGYCILSTTQHPQEAWELTRYMAGEPGMRQMTVSGLQPAIKWLAESSAWIPGPNAPPELKRPASIGITDKAVDYVVFGPTADYWRSVSDAAGAPIDRLTTNETSSAAEALGQAQIQASQKLQQYLREQSNAAYPWGTGLVLTLLALAGMIVWVYWPLAGRRPGTRRERREAWAAYKFLSPWIIGMIVFTVGPMALSFLMSLADWDIIQPAKWRGIGNYAEATTIDPNFWVSLKVTFIYSAVGVPLGLVCALALALLLNQKVRGIPLFRAFFYVPSMASGVAAALIWRRVFNPDSGILNTVLYSPVGHLLGITHVLDVVSGKPGEPVNWIGNEKTALAAFIIMGLWGVGGGMVILLAGLQGIPQGYYEAATVDGAGAWRRFRSVTLPLLTPTIFFSLLTGVIGSFQGGFTQAMVMTNGGPNNSTLFYMLNLYNMAFASTLRMGYASALAWVLFVIILVFSLAQVAASRRWVYYEAETR